MYDIPHRQFVNRQRVNPSFVDEMCRHCNGNTLITVHRSELYHNVLRVYVTIILCVCASIRAFVHVCVCARENACVCACVSVCESTRV